MVEVVSNLRSILRGNNLVNHFFMSYERVIIRV